MLWEDFINSYWRDWRTGDRSKDRDMLEDQEWMSKWLEQHRLTVTHMPPDLKQLKALRQLRSILWDGVQKVVAGHQLAKDQFQLLNQYMAEGAVTRIVIWSDDGQPKLVLHPLHTCWEQVMAEIAASYVEALLEKETSRFRICDNPDCLWVYYDDTRNRSKRYCDDKACGNLMKVRRFRARKKAGI